MEIGKPLFRPFRKFRQLSLFLTPVVNMLSATIGQSSSITELSGEQFGEYARGEYIVTHNVIIPEEKTMTIQTGTVIRFKQYTGLIVKGKLECIGTTDTSILFTSEKIQSPSDRNTSDESFLEWNGIEIISGGSVHAEYVRINNSVFGIKSEKKYKSILLEKVVFSNNVQNFSIADQIIHIKNDVEFSFPVIKKNEVTITPSKAEKDTIVIKEVKEIKVIQDTSEKTAANFKARKRKRWKPPVLLGFGTCAIGGGILGIYYYNKAKEKKSEYDVSRDDNTTEKREEAEFFYSLSYILGGIGVAGILGFSISVFF